MPVQTATAREERKEEREAVFPLLLLAKPSAGALRWSLKNLSDAVYVMEDGGRRTSSGTPVYNVARRRRTRRFRSSGVSPPEPFFAHSSRLSLAAQTRPI